MNQLWQPPQQCTCGCDPCQCQECPPLFADPRLVDCWRQISAFKRMIEEIISQMGVTSGDTGPAGPQGVAGPAGPAGPQGPAGMAIAYVGPTAPPSATDGELWLNTTDNSLNIYENGSWVDISGGGVGVVGPMGPQGQQGVQGPVGPAGPQGVAGPAGSPGSDGSAGGQPVSGGTVTITASTPTVDIWADFSQPGLYEIRFTDVIMAYGTGTPGAVGGNDMLGIQLSFDGSTFDSGANYTWSANPIGYPTYSVYGANTATPDTMIRVGSYLTLWNATSNHGVLRIANPGLTRFKTFSVDTTNCNAQAGSETNPAYDSLRWIGNGQYMAGSSPLRGIRFLGQSGGIVRGKFSVYNLG